MPLSEDRLAEIAVTPLKEVSKLVRLVLGLSTGAVVLFTNLLVSVSGRCPRWLLALLVASIVAFGIATVQCLLVPIKLIQAHNLLAKAVAAKQENKSLGIYEQEKDVWADLTSKIATRLVWFLSGGVFLAAAFVTAMLLTRC